MVMKEKIFCFLASVFHSHVAYLMKFTISSTSMCILKIILLHVHIRKYKWWLLRSPFISSLYILDDPDDQTLYASVTFDTQQAQSKCIPENIGMTTDEVVCKVAAAVGVQIAPENIEISHRLHRKKGIKPIIAKFPNHKDKAKLYKARVQLKHLTLSSLFPNYSATGLAGQRIFIDENLTSYRSYMMKLAIEKRKDGKILSTWSLDGKIFIKTFPSGRPRLMFSMEEIKNL